MGKIVCMNIADLGGEPKVSDLYLFSFRVPVKTCRIHEAKICFHKLIIRAGQCTKLVIEGSWTACLEMVWRRSAKVYLGQ